LPHYKFLTIKLLHFLFAWRYFKAKKTTNAINILAWISIVAIVIGTAALILILSVFNGLEGLVKSLYSSFYPDLKVSAVQGKFITVTAEQLKKLHGFEGIRNFSLVAEEKALIQNLDGNYQSITSLKGVDSNYTRVTGVADHIVKGNFETGNVDSPLLVLGAGVENALHVSSDRNLFQLKVYLGKRTNSRLLNEGDLSTELINTSGTFVIQQEFDNKYAITNLDFVRRMLQLKPDEYGAIEIVLNDPTQATEQKNQLVQIFGAGYKIQNRYEQNQSLYSVMQLEKWAIYAVLTLLLLIAAFNMIGSLTMLVLEKQKDINVLIAMGTQRNFIQKIFLSEGLLIAIIGGVIGMVLALVIAWLQIHFKLISLEGGSFLIDYFPITLKISDFLLVGLTVLVIALLASWLPSRKAALNEFNLRSE
jgi:lipoprotein-releasing system permease protein